MISMATYILLMFSLFLRFARARAQLAKAHGRGGVAFQFALVTRAGWIYRGREVPLRCPLPVLRSRRRPVPVTGHLSREVNKGAR